MNDQDLPDVATAAPFVAIVVAAGRGERLGGSVVKALMPIAGRPLVLHAVERLVAAGARRVVVVHPDGGGPAFRGVLEHADVGAAAVTLVPGGATRSASVRAGLAALAGLPGLADLTGLAGRAAPVAVHDAARGLQPAAVIARTVEAVTGAVVAAAPAVPIADTLKAVDGDRIVGTVDRAGTVAVQTPQVFAAEVLHEVHTGDAEATDDLALVESRIADGRLTGSVVAVAGSPLGMKVTHPADLAVATALLGAVERP